MRKIKSKLVITALIVLAVICLLLSFAKTLGYGLSYQGSISMPQGWYWLKPIALPLAHKTIVVFHPDDATRHYLLAHKWLRPRVVLMKYVFAGPGDDVCIKQHTVWINGNKTVDVLANYAVGKPLPQLVFCRALGGDEYWLMSDKIVNSFDSRYFGPVKINNIIAKAYPI